MCECENELLITIEHCIIACSFIHSSESQLQYKEVCVQLQQQTQLIEQLTADNHRLVAQIEGQSLSTSSHHDQLQQALKEKNNLLAELERTKSSLALAQLTATQLEKVCVCVCTATA